MELTVRHIRSQLRDLFSSLNVKDFDNCILICYSNLFQVRLDRLDRRSSGRTFLFVFALRVFSFES